MYNGRRYEWRHAVTREGDSVLYRWYGVEEEEEEPCKTWQEGRKSSEAWEENGRDVWRDDAESAVRPPGPFLVYFSFFCLGATVDA